MSPAKRHLLVTGCRDAPAYPPAGMHAMHKYYLAQHSDSYKLLPLDKFSVEDINLLCKYGSWMRALYDNEIIPSTAAQKKFVDCANGFREAQTKYERLFCKYLDYTGGFEAQKTRLKTNALDKNSKTEIQEFHSPGSDFTPTCPWNEANFDDIVKAQKNPPTEIPHQFTGGINDQDEDNYDPTAIH